MHEWELAALDEAARRSGERHVSGLSGCEGIHGDPIGIEEGRKHHMNMDHSAWEGWVIDGKVDTVLSRGTVVIRNDEYVGRKGHGQYIKRGLSQYLV